MQLGGHTGILWILALQGRVSNMDLMVMAVQRGKWEPAGVK